LFRHLYKAYKSTSFKLTTCNCGKVGYASGEYRTRVGIANVAEYS